MTMDDEQRAHLEELLRTHQVAYPYAWGDERIGYNPFGTTCAAEFTGWIYEGRWVQP